MVVRTDSGKSRGSSPARSARKPAAKAAVRKPAAPTAKKAGVRKPAGAAAKTSKKASESRLSAAVTKALPGWKLVVSAARKSGSVEDEIVRIKQGPSMSELKRKFLGIDDAQNDSADAFEADNGRVPVRIRPKDGGEAKTADIGPDGAVSIVQG